MPSHYFARAPLLHLVAWGALFLLAIGTPAAVSAQTELTTVRPQQRFNPVFEIRSGTVQVIHLLADGRAYVGGVFSRFDGAPRDSLVRLNPDGTLDSTFTPPAIRGGVTALAVQSDGKVLVGLGYTYAGGPIRYGIARLQSNGSLDPSFTSPLTSAASAIVVQSTGKILVGGTKLVDGATPLYGLVRLNATGSLDATFPAQTNYAIVNALAVQTDERIIAGGHFVSMFDQSRQNVMRLSSDGVPDSAFNAALSFDAITYALLAQPDQKLVIGGDTSPTTGVSETLLARFNPDGTRDTGFAAPRFFGIRAILRQTDGQLIVAGPFTVADGAAANLVARVGTDGSLDTSFSALDPSGSAATLRSLYAAGLLADGRLLIGSALTGFASKSPPNGLARLDANGALDSGYTPELHRPGFVTAITPTTQGRWLVTGPFHYIDNVAAHGIARIRPDGAIDTTFNPGAGFDLVPKSLISQPDGQLIAYGGFTNYNGAAVTSVVRLRVDGSLDPTFPAGSGFDDIVTSVAALENGAFLATGAFRNYNGTARRNIARFAADGTLDSTFAPTGGSTRFGGAIIASPLLAVASEGGSLVVQGPFDNYSGVARTGFVRMAANGTIDTTFDAGPNVDMYWTGQMLALAGGKVLVGGLRSPFTQVNAAIVRLGSNGSVDPTFETSGQGSGALAGVLALGPQQTNGSVFVVARSASPVPREPGLWRITNQGLVDSSFAIPGLLAAQEVYGAAFDAVGHLVIAGSWSDHSTFSGHGLVLLEASSGPSITSALVVEVPAGNAINYAITGTDSPTSFNATGLPIGITVNQNTGTLSGTLTQSGYFPITLSATNAQGTGSAQLHLTVGPMIATVTIGDLSQTYNGAPRPVSIVTNPGGLAASVLYDGVALPPTAAGTYEVEATISAPGYSGQAHATLTVARAMATVAITATNQTYDGSPHAITTSTTPAGLAVDVAYDGSSSGVGPILPGVYGVTATIVDANHVGSSDATLTIARIVPAIALGSTSHSFDGTPKAVSVTTDPPGLPFSVTYDGTVSPPITVGSHLVAVTVDETLYGATTTGLLQIAPVLVQGQTGPVTSNAGSATVLSVSAQGASATASFQWQYEQMSAGPAASGPRASTWIDVPGATTSSYTIPSTQRFNSGNYRVVVNDNGVSVASEPFVVSVNVPAPSNARLLNLSTRGLAESGANQLFPGFVVNGPGTKKLLIRAVGPTLDLPPINFGGGTLPDPAMQLKRFNFTTGLYEDIIANDDWHTNPNAAVIITTSATLGAFELKDAKDAALLVDLPAGQYAVVAGDKNGTSGIGIVELYDADAVSPTATLINISNRGFCGVGAQVMIPGFVVSSEGPKTLLVRVVGPKLTFYNVPGTMADPKLALYQHNFTTNVDDLLLTQDNWSDNPDAAYTNTIANQVSAFPLDAGSADAAFVVTLEPGVYTVVGSSSDGTSSGVVLVEIYVVN